VRKPPANPGRSPTHAEYLSVSYQGWVNAHHVFAATMPAKTISQKNALNTSLRSLSVILPSVCPRISGEAIPQRINDFYIKIINSRLISETDGEFS
jgi:hypothetical protein